MDLLELLCLIGIGMYIKVLSTVCSLGTVTSYGSGTVRKGTTEMPSYCLPGCVSRFPYTWCPVRRYNRGMQGRFLSGRAYKWGLTARFCVEKVQQRAMVSSYAFLRPFAGLCGGFRLEKVQQSRGGWQ